MRNRELFKIFKFISFFGKIRPAWIRIRIQIPNPDLDPLTHLNLDPEHRKLHSINFTHEKQTEAQVLVWLLIRGKENT